LETDGYNFETNVNAYSQASAVSAPLANFSWLIRQFRP